MIDTCQYDKWFDLNIPPIAKCDNKEVAMESSFKGRGGILKNRMGLCEKHTRAFYRNSGDPRTLNDIEAELYYVRQGWIKTLFFQCPGCDIKTPRLVSMCHHISRMHGKEVRDRYLSQFRRKRNFDNIDGD